jgi:hypothetical protein
MTPTELSAYDEELWCVVCGKTLGFGHGDFNCTYIMCPECLAAGAQPRVEPPEAK